VRCAFTGEYPSAVLNDIMPYLCKEVRVSFREIVEAVEDIALFLVSHNCEHRADTPLGHAVQSEDDFQGCAMVILPAYVEGPSIIVILNVLPLRRAEK